jgi:hypothetical protein
MAENPNPTGLVPDFQDEVIITVRYLGDNPPAIGLLRRRVTFKRGEIVLAQPEAEPIPESHSIAILLEVVKAASMGAIQLKEEQEKFAIPGVIRA